MSSRATDVQIEQRREALARANSVRRARADLKRRISEGHVSAAHAILVHPTEIDGMPVGDVLMSQRQWGATRCRKALLALGVQQSKPIGAMTDRQRRSLASRLSARTTPSAPDRKRGQGTSAMTLPTAQTANGSVTSTAVAARTASGEAMTVDVIALEGEFDLSNVSQLEAAIDHGIAAGRRDFIADLSDVDFLDARSLHALREGSNRAARCNGQLVLANPPAPIRRLLDLIGVSETLTTFVSRQEALAYFAGRNA